MKKYELKKYLMKSMELCFEKLYEMLSPTSEYYNDIIHLKMRYQRIVYEQHKGIVSEENRNLELNKVQIALIEFLDKLEEPDFELSNKSNSPTSKSNEKQFNHFWKPFFEFKTTIVFGTKKLNRYNNWEVSNVMGANDAIALGTIMGVLNNLGIKGLDVIPTYKFTGDRYENNLILLGGNSANNLTEEIIDRLETIIKFGHNNQTALYDSKENKQYSPTFNQDNEITRDYGIIYKTENPFNPEARVIIIAGCFGFGTCSAAKFFESDSLLRKVKKSKNNGFEALVSSDVISDWVQKPKIIESYEL